MSTAVWQRSDDELLAELATLEIRLHSTWAHARGEPLDIGRSSYTAPTAIRRAVILRDAGCAFPGCSVPARWCDIHHVTHWADHGPHQRRKLHRALRSASSISSPFRVANRHDRRYPAISPTILARRTTTPQPLHTPRDSFEPGNNAAHSRRPTQATSIRHRPPAGPGLGRPDTVAESQRFPLRVRLPAAARVGFGLVVRR